MTIARGIAASSLILSATLLLGRLAGFLREVQLAAVFGVSRDADFAVVLLTTPDLLVNLLLSGGLSVALIPEFARLDPGGRTQLFLRASLLVLALFGVVAVLVALFPWLLMLAFAPGYLGVSTEEYGAAFAIASVAIPLAGIVGVSSALLNAQHKFFVAGSGTLIFNLAIIAVLLLGASIGDQLLVLATGIALAALLRYMSQLLACLPHLSRAKGDVQPTGARRLAVRFTQALGASTLILLIPVILRAIVSLGNEGNIAAFNYATKLVELPLGIAITTISTVAFPALSRAVSGSDGAEEQRVLGDGIQRGLCLAICITIPCLWFSPALVEVVFGRGRVGPDDLTLISDMARLGFLTLPSVAISSMAMASLNARGQTGLLFRMTLATIVLLPVLAAPGLLVGDAKLVIAALPAFHLIYAVVLSRSAALRMTEQLRTMGRPLAASILATSAGALALESAGADAAWLGAGVAIVAMAIALLGSGGLTRGRRVAQN